MTKEEIEGQLRLSKRQNKNERYDYLCSQFNCVNYVINLEKYTNNLQKENQELQQENEKLHSYKTLYQSLKNQKEELRDWLKEMLDNKNDIFSIVRVKDVLSKLEELEGVSNE